MKALAPKRYKWTDQEKQEVLDELLPRLSSGETLVDICKDANMPGLRTVYDWRDGDEVIAARIARAREDGEEALAAGLLWIARNATPETVNCAKLEIHTTFQLLARWDPDKWSEKARTHAPVAAHAPQVFIVGIEPKGLVREAIDGEALAVRALEGPA